MNALHWWMNINLSVSHRGQKAERQFLLRPQGEHVVFETTFHFHSATYAQLERRQKKLGYVGDACLNELKLSFTYRDKIIQFISVTFSSVRCMCTLPQPLAETG